MSAPEFTKAVSYKLRPIEPAFAKNPLPPSLYVTKVSNISVFALA